jgi:hypothetical protein
MWKRFPTETACAVPPGPARPSQRATTCADVERQLATSNTGTERPLSDGDLFGPWPVWRRWLWVGLATLLVLLRAPRLVDSVLLPDHVVRDFFQEWSSARNLLEGLPVYAPLDESARRYLQQGEYHEYDVLFKWNVNAHPPASVLLLAPLALLDYHNAFLIWSLFSLAALGLSCWLAFRQLGARLSCWSLLPALVLLLHSNPFQQQLYWGQLNLLLLLLIVGTWAAERSGRPYVAGFLLAVAASIKLFPAFLFLGLVLSRRWKTVLAGLVSLAAIAGISVMLLGVSTYQEYISSVVPVVGTTRSEWINASLPGLWRKLFDPETTCTGGKAEALFTSPLLAQILSAVSCAAIILVCCWLSGRSKNREGHDHAFGIGIIAMLLVCPITWDHYFLLLLLPLCLLCRALPRSGIALWLFLGCVTVLWMGTPVRWTVPDSSLDLLYGARFAIAPVTVSVGQTLTTLSLHCYALILLFLLSASLFVRSNPSVKSPGARPLRGPFRFGLLPF